MTSAPESQATAEDGATGTRGAAAALDYALIHGQGRSGTNFLMGVLNQSPVTHCRNEPDQLKDSALRRLSPFRFFVDDEEALAALWDDAIVDSAARIGPRDHGIHWNKDWIYPGMRAPGYFYVYRHYRFMHRFVHRTKAMDGTERFLPFWMSSPERLRKAYHVFKINAFVGVAAWSLRNRPDAKALHIVRHPGGFAKSWYRRWVQGKTPQGTSDQGSDWDEKKRLEVLVERDPVWAERIGDPGGFDQVDCELWWWRYCTEETAAAGEGSPSYLRILYEDLSARTLEETRRVFDFLGLPWSDLVERRVRSIAEEAAAITSDWRDELESHVVDAVDRITADSPALAWWG